MSTEIIHEKQDLTYLSWSLIRSSSGTAGSFLKATDDLQQPKIYYKLSNYDGINGIVGHECINEIIVDRLLNILEIEHLHYDLIHADIDVDGKEMETYLCASKDFKAHGEHKVALDAYYQAEKLDGETPLQFCTRNGWSDFIYKMLVVDFLILNRDRHGANIEVLRNARKKSLRLAPIFDHGLSLLFNCHTEEEINQFDVMKDRAVQCFVGSRSAQQNLMLIPKDEILALNPLQHTHKAYLLEGLDGIIPQSLQNKIWDMIWQRWEYYEIFAVRDEDNTTNKAVAYLFYYEKEKRFYIELPEEADPWETPLILSFF